LEVARRDGFEEAAGGIEMRLDLATEAARQQRLQVLLINCQLSAESESWPGRLIDSACGAQYQRGGSPSSQISGKDAESLTRSRWIVRRFTSKSRSASACRNVSVVVPGVRRGTRLSMVIWRSVVSGMSAFPPFPGLSSVYPVVNPVTFSKSESASLQGSALRLALRECGRVDNSGQAKPHGDFRAANKALRA